MKQTDLILGILSLLSTILGLGLLIVTRVISHHYKYHALRVATVETPAAAIFEDAETSEPADPLAPSDLDEPNLDSISDTLDSNLDASPDLEHSDLLGAETTTIQRFVAVPVETAPFRSPDAVAHEIRRVDDFLRF